MPTNIDINTYLLKFMCLSLYSDIYISQKYLHGLCF